MIKYVDTLIGFIEIPNEITLCINISNCLNHCEGCHSPWLLKDEGTPLTYISLKSLIKANKGITCVCFMGGDKEPWEINRLAKLVKEDYNFKVGWYSGKEEISKEINLDNFDYIKIGPYKKEFGPLNAPTTNQQLYEIYRCTNGTTILIDITNYYWKKYDRSKSKRKN